MMEITRITKGNGAVFIFKEQQYVFYTATGNLRLYNAKISSNILMQGSFRGIVQYLINKQ